MTSGDRLAMNGDDDVLSAGVSSDDDDAPYRRGIRLRRRTPTARWLLTIGIIAALLVAAVVVIVQTRQDTRAKRASATDDVAILVTAQQQHSVRLRAMITALIELADLATPEDPDSYHRAAAALIGQQSAWLHANAATLQTMSTDASDADVRAGAAALAGAFADEAGDLDVTATSLTGVRPPDTALSGNVTTELSMANRLIDQVRDRTGQRSPDPRFVAPLPAVPQDLLRAMTTQFDASMVHDRLVMVSGDYGTLWVDPVTGETKDDPARLVANPLRVGSAVVGDIWLGSQQASDGILLLSAGRPARVLSTVGKVAGAGPEPGTLWVARLTYMRPDVVLYGIDGDQLRAPVPLSDDAIAGYGTAGRVVVANAAGCPGVQARFSVWDPVTGAHSAPFGSTCGDAVVGAGGGTVAWLSGLGLAPVVHLTDIATGHDRTVTVPADVLNTGALSPDGRHVALLAGRADRFSVGEARVVVVDTRTGAVRESGTIGASGSVLGVPAWASDSSALYLQVPDRPTGRARLALVRVGSGSPATGRLSVVLADHALPNAPLASTPGRVFGGSIAVLAKDR